VQQDRLADTASPYLRRQSLALLREAWGPRSANSWAATGRWDLIISNGLGPASAVVVVIGEIDLETVWLPEVGHVAGVLAVAAAGGLGFVWCWQAQAERQ
jgi:hypothetical protein